MLIVGLISGTSADGIDAALCRIEGEPPNLRATILHALTYEYPDGFQARVHRNCQPALSRVDDLCELNAEIGEHFAAAALRVAVEAGFSPDEIDLIGSHGQTVWHMVQPDGRATSTLQLGEGSVIAERTGITTISNFRPRDVAAGGQGAPLTSYADWVLLRHPSHWRAVQNLGGIANTTFLPPLSDEQTAPLAFDNGPSNSLIDAVIVLLTGGKQTLDRDGLMAARGQIDAAWLDDLLEHEYYARKPPKTTGRELFGAEMGEALLAEGRARGLADEDIVATLTMLSAASIADSFDRFAPGPVGEVILGGGGARNPVLVEMLRQRLGGIPLRTHEDIGMDSFNKEALVFALLAHETWHMRPGTHPALTGAAHASVLGQITPARNTVGLLSRTWGSA